MLPSTATVGQKASCLELKWGRFPAGFPPLRTDRRFRKAVDQLIELAAFGSSILAKAARSPALGNNRTKGPPGPWTALFASTQVRPGVSASRRPSVNNSCARLLILHFDILASPLNAAALAAGAPIYQP
jgi:hypothetical protein